MCLCVSYSSQLCPGDQASYRGDKDNDGLKLKPFIYHISMKDLTYNFLWTLYVHLCDTLHVL